MESAGSTLIPGLRVQIVSFHGKYTTVHLPHQCCLTAGGLLSHTDGLTPVLLAHPQAHAEANPQSTTSQICHGSSRHTVGTECCQHAEHPCKAPCCSTAARQLPSDCASHPHYCPPPHFFPATADPQRKSELQMSKSSIQYSCQLPSRSLLMLGRTHARPVFWTCQLLCSKAV